MVAQFVDISSFQPETLDWQAYKAWSASGDGVSRVAMRSSYGVGYADTHFQTYRDGALAAGIDMIIYYHYAYPSLNNPVDEAKWQKQVVGGIRALDTLILDFEENVVQATSDWAYAWLAQQEDSYGKLPGIYASSAYIAQRLNDSRLARFPLWLANWQFTPDERPPVPAPWSSYEFVQYTDRATIPGIPGEVDADIFLGGTIPMPQQPGTHQIQAANDSWDSVLKNVVAGPAPRGTGIYEQWRACLIAGKFYGPPLTHEYNSVDWSGNAIVVQEFAHARCEWDEQKGLLGWYSVNGKI